MQSMESKSNGQQTVEKDTRLCDRKRRNVLKERHKVYCQIENGEMEMWRVKK